MHGYISAQIRRILRDKEKRRRWLSAFLLLAIIVTLTTAELLTLPSEAKNHTKTVLACAYEPHIHTADCYDENGGLICGQADFVLHVHNEDCYDENGQLVCALPELAPHRHTEACWGEHSILSCGLEESEGHVHTEECRAAVRGELICGLAEGEGAHIHDGDCYTLTRGELLCNDESEEHVHTDECYDWVSVLSCGLEETEGHVHTDDCYVWNEELICGLEEGEGAHTHDADCYELVRTLECGQEELLPHSHTADCYDENGALICGQLELGIHVHNGDCLHTVELTADEVAERNGTHVGVDVWPELNGSWREDFLRVAELELGCGESETDVSVGADGVLRGATRYGEWYGDPYGSWETSFLAYCLNAAQIPAKAVPRSNDTAAWLRDLTGAGLEFVSDLSEAVPGDLLFLDSRLLQPEESEGDAVAANHAAVVSGFSLSADGELELSVIEGNEGAVREGRYPVSSPAILALVRLPDQEVWLENERNAAYPAQSFTGQTETVRVYVEADAGTFPPNTFMLVDAVEEETVLEAVSSAVEQPDESRTLKAEALDITFYNEAGEEIEPAKPIRVTMSSAVIAEAAEPRVVHLDGEGGANLMEQKVPAQLDTVPAEDEIVFASDSFSVYAIVYTVELQTYVITDSGETWLISVTYNENSGIPEEAELHVREIGPEDEGYATYYDRAVEAAGYPLTIGEDEAPAVPGLTRFFDIEIWADGARVEPQAPVDVRMSLADLSLSPLETLQVVHFAPAGPELMELLEDETTAEEATETAGTATELYFKTDGFSVYSIVSARNNDLNGKTFALVSRDAQYGNNNYDSTKLVDQALMASQVNRSNINGMDSQPARIERTGAGGVVGGDATLWTFERVGNYNYANNGNNNTYRIKDSATGKYLRANGSSLTLVTGANNATTFTVGISDNGRINLKNGSDYVTNRHSGWGDSLRFFYMVNGGRGDGGSTESSWFNLCQVDHAYDEFKATKISAADLSKYDTKQVIVYTKVKVGGEDKFYAIADDGTVKEIFDDGGSLYWRRGTDDKNISWDLTAYKDADSGAFNGYYEFTSSRDANKIMAPQPDGSVIQDHAVGLNLKGAAEGSYSSPLEAWDTDTYSWFGPQLNNARTAFEAVASEHPMEFMFAVVSPLNEPAIEPQTVETVDSIAKGIKLTMFNYEPLNWNGNQTYCSWSSGDTSLGNQVRIWSMYDLMYGNSSVNPGGQNYDDFVHDQTTNLVGKLLGSDGYPVSTMTGNSIGALFGALQEGDNPTTRVNTSGVTGSHSMYVYETDNVNHLFLQSEYDETGYFYYSSTENYAHLTTDENGNSVFDVYQQVASPHSDPRNDEQYYYHGHFMPYNEIDVSTVTGNTIMTDEDADWAGSGGITSGDPRAYETVYGVKNRTASETENGSAESIPNYFFGMKLEATFTMPKNGVQDAAVVGSEPIIFEFAGDDDFWFFVDGVRVLDLGGVHDAVSGRVDFHTGNVYAQNGTGQLTLVGDLKSIFQDALPTSEFAKYKWRGNTFADYSSHEIKAFFMERGAGASNLTLKYDLPVLHGLALEKKVSNTDKLKYTNERFAYQLYKIEDDQPVLFIPNEPDEAVYEGTTKPVEFNEDGVFFLNPGEAVNFPKMELKDHYFFKELGLESDYYRKVLVNDVEVDRDHIEPTPDEEHPEDYIKTILPNDANGYYTDEELKRDENDNIIGTEYSVVTTTDSVKNRGRVIYENVINPQELHITKEMVGAEMPGETFDFRLLLESWVENDEGVAEKKLVPYSQMPYTIIKDTDRSTRATLETDSRGVITGEMHHDTYYYWKSVGGELVLQSTTNKEEATMISSVNGWISRIPPGYTVCVDKLAAGTQFYVYEDVDEEYYLLLDKEVLPDNAYRWAYSGPDPVNEQPADEDRLSGQAASNDTDKEADAVILGKDAPAQVVFRNARFITVEETDVTVSKSWVDENGDPVTAPSGAYTIGFTLKRDRSEDGGETWVEDTSWSKTMTLPDGGSWTKTYPNLPTLREVRDARDKVVETIAYRYYVEEDSEDSPEGFAWGGCETETDEDGNITVTAVNKKVPKLILQKQWDRDAGDPEPTADLSLTVKRFIGGDESRVDSWSQRVTLTKADHWRKELTSLPFETATEPHESYTYFVVEDPYSGYTYKESSLTRNEDGDWVLTIVNEQVPKLTVRKVWQNDAGSSVPNVNLSLTLKRSVEGVEDTGFHRDFNLNSGNSWQAVFDDLERQTNEETPRPYTYYVVENNIPEGYAHVDGDRLTGPDANGDFILTVTNKQVPQLAVEKKWLDRNGQEIDPVDGSVTLTLWREVRHQEWQMPEGGAVTQPVEPNKYTVTITVIQYNNGQTREIYRNTEVEEGSDFSFVANLWYGNYPTTCTVGGSDLQYTDSIVYCNIGGRNIGATREYSLTNIQSNKAIIISYGACWPPQVDGMVNQTQEGSAFAVSVRPPETPPGPQPVLTWTEWERDTAFAISGYTASNGYVQVPVNYAGHWEQNFYAGQLPTQPDSSTEFNFDYRYYVSEEDSPFGYELVGYTYTYGFETGAASEDVEPDGTPTNGGVGSGVLTAINQQQAVYELPMTGGPGDWPFVLTGALMVFGAALLLLQRLGAGYRRKHKKPIAAVPQRPFCGKPPPGGGDSPR